MALLNQYVPLPISRGQEVFSLYTLFFMYIFFVIYKYIFDFPSLSITYFANHVAWEKEERCGVGYVLISTCLKHKHNSTKSSKF